MAVFRETGFLPYQRNRFKPGWWKGIHRGFKRPRRKTCAFESRTRYMAYTSYEDQKNYQKKWIADRRLKVLGLLGNRCVMCGCTEQLQVDHIDPSLKDPCMKRPGTNGFKFGIAWVRILKELENCQLLCSSCHRGKTYGWLYESA